MAGSTQLSSEGLKSQLGHRSQKSYDRVAIPLPLTRLRARAVMKQEVIESTAGSLLNAQSDGQQTQAPVSRDQASGHVSADSRQDDETGIVYTPESRASDDVKGLENSGTTAELQNHTAQDSRATSGNAQEATSQQRKQEPDMQLVSTQALAETFTQQESGPDEPMIVDFDANQVATAHDGPPQDSRPLEQALPTSLADHVSTRAQALNTRDGSQYEGQQVLPLPQASRLTNNHPAWTEQHSTSNQHRATRNAGPHVRTELHGPSRIQRNQMTHPGNTSAPPMGLRSENFLPGSSAMLANHALLVQHITSSLTSSAFYPDVNVRIVDLHGMRLERPAHRMLLARSPRLKKILANAQSAHPLNLTLPGRWMSARGFHVMIEWMYGREALTAALVASGQDTLNVETLLGAISVAHFLELGVAAAELTVAASPLLQWDSIPVALHFALDGTFSSLMDWSTHMSSPFPSRNTPRPYNDPDATQLLHAIIHFLLYNFPHDFYSDAQAKELEFMQRLPISLQPAEALASSSIDLHVSGHRATRSLNSARLSQIQFGQADNPKQHREPIRPSPINSTLSSVLYSLPFGLLKILLEHPILVERIGAETVASVMRQIIAERETRREVANRQMRFSGKGSGVLLDHAAQNTFWEERLEETNDTAVGLQITRHKIGS